MNSTYRSRFGVGRTMLLLATAALVALAAAPARAQVPSYQYNFGPGVPGVNDWSEYWNYPAPGPGNPYIVGSPNTTQGPGVPNGGGQLGLTSPVGGYYYETLATSPYIGAFGTDNPNGPFAPNIAEAGYSAFGGNYNSNNGPFLGNWAQSIAVYINPTGAGWANNPGGAFQIDGSPGASPTASNSIYNDEAQINVTERGWQGRCDQYECE